MKREREGERESEREREGKRERNREKKVNSSFSKVNDGYAILHALIHYKEAPLTPPTSNITYPGWRLSQGMTRRAFSS